MLITVNLQFHQRLTLKRLDWSQIFKGKRQLGAKMYRFLWAWSLANRFCNRLHCSWISQLIYYSQMRECLHARMHAINAHNWHVWMTDKWHAASHMCIENECLSMCGRILKRLTDLVVDPYLLSTRLDGCCYPIFQEKVLLTPALRCFDYHSNRLWF